MRNAEKGIKFSTNIFKNSINIFTFNMQNLYINITLMILFDTNNNDTNDFTKMILIEQKEFRKLWPAA